jgi:REP element-mobilizing transposase RayT
MARGIDRKNIFKDDTDRDNFLERLGAIIEETRTHCFAWALIPNHFHLLMKTGTTPISTVMGRLLTGYPVPFNNVIVDMAIFFKTVTNRFYARKIPIFWNWYAIFILTLYEPDSCAI